MNLTWTTFSLKLKRPFRIARSVRETNETVVLRIEHDGVVGYGEASPSPRYGESVEGVIAFFRKLELSRFDSLWQVEDIMAWADSLELGNHAAKCALDVALHDWQGRSIGQPLHRVFGLNPHRSAHSSYTVGIGSRQEIIEKLAEAESYPILKIKLGTSHDIETMETVRSLTRKKIYVDANEGWKTRELARERLRWLEDFEVEFVEQPMPAGSLDDIRWLKDQSSLPLVADEDVSRLSSLSAVASAYDGINIKIQKCTGLREAFKMIATARALGLKVMLGCMIESSIGISAAAQLAPLVDYADLDGNILITNDPFDGVRNLEGSLVLSDLPGIGVSPRLDSDASFNLQTANIGKAAMNS